MATTYVIDMNKVKALAYDKRFMNMNELSRKARLSPATLFALMAKRRKASRLTASKIAAALEVDPAEIIAR